MCSPTIFSISCLFDFHFSKQRKQKHLRPIVKPSLHLGFDKNLFHEDFVRLQLPCWQSNWFAWAVPWRWSTSSVVLRSFLQRAWKVEAKDVDGSVRQRPAPCGRFGVPVVGGSILPAGHWEMRGMLSWWCPCGRHQVNSWSTSEAMRQKNGRRRRGWWQRPLNNF